MSDMTTSADVIDLATLSDAELGERVQALEREEHAVSRRRTTLHTRIDFVRAGGYASTDPEYEPLKALEASERELSAHRLEIHAQIDALRAECSLRRL
jgi:hypothetical protein